MKKLFTFLALMLCYVGMAGAQTEVTATWAFDTGTSGQTAIITAENVFAANYVETAMTYSGKITFGTDKSLTGTMMQPATNKAADGTEGLAFVLQPMKGITFIPTKISFNVIRCGTDGSKMLHYYAICGDNNVDLGDVWPNRNKNYDATKLEKGYTGEWSFYEHEISGLEATNDNPLKLMCYVYGLANDKSIAFSNIVIEGTYSGDAVQETMYTITSNVTPEGSGTIIQTPAASSIAEGTEVTFSATANVGYKFLNKWTVNGNEVEGETYSIASLSENTEVVAQFKKLPTISFAKPEGVHCVNRMFPATVNTYDVGQTYSLPYNYMYYKEGYTMTGWEINGSEYKCGDAYTVTEENVTATPVFTRNTTSIASRSGELTVKFDFDQATNNGRVVNIENNEDYFITTVNVGGEDIDVALSINCKDNAGIEGKRGKFNNTSGSRAQVNPGAVLNISLEQGGTITINSDNINFKEGFTFNGVVGTIDGATITYTAEKAEEVIVISQQENMYIKSVVITYPAPSYTLTTADTDFYGLYLPYQASVPEGITAYTGALSDDQATLTLSKVEGVIPANTAVLVKSNAVGEYTFNVSNEETVEAIANNSLKGVTVETAVSELEEGKTVLTLGVADGIVAFRQPAAETIKANKVYLLVDAASSAKIRIVEGEATGIEENYEFGIKNSDAATYDLSGRKVANPAKGLYIKSGKKFIVK